MGKSASDSAALPNSTDCLSGIREEVESLSCEDRMEEFISSDCARLKESLWMNSARRFDRDILEVYGPQIRKMEEQDC